MRESGVGIILVVGTLRGTSGREIRGGMEKSGTRVGDGEGVEEGGRQRRAAFIRAASNQPRFFTSIVCHEVV